MEGCLEQQEIFFSLHLTGQFAVASRRNLRTVTLFFLGETTNNKSQILTDQGSLREHKTQTGQTESIVADGGLPGTPRDLFLAPFNWQACSRNLRTVTVKAIIMEHWVAGLTNNYSYRRRDEREFCLGCRN
ncbi:hypothetical protein CDAR_109071 [Caerostris darwini]|uniref:Uncharacterized protein n=1 Tax=Caerostris darwini TaxID=1538125 RepID=A0AAV4VEC9_9ARAC|nr:hypothetical protein CDAR_109071 [Caerostris darwini]